jgi:hypothetical protein
MIHTEHARDAMPTYAELAALNRPQFSRHSAAV